MPTEISFNQKNRCPVLAVQDGPSLGKWLKSTGNLEIMRQMRDVFYLFRGCLIDSLYIYIYQKKIIYIGSTPYHEPEVTNSLLAFLSLRTSMVRSASERYGTPWAPSLRLVHESWTYHIIVMENILYRTLNIQVDDVTQICLYL